jgi:predicted Zn finger-like uncharacterized protein
MIIECEKCTSQFRLDETTLKPGGSKVRCSVCSHVFTAYPPEEVPVEEPATDDYMEDALAETVALDSPPVFEEEAGPPEEGGAPDFDEAFEEAMAEEEVRPVSLDDIPEEEEGLELLDMAEAVDRAATIEEEIIREDAERKVSEMPPAGEAGEATAKIPPAKKKRGRMRLFPIILVIIVVVLAGALGIFFLAPDLIPDSLSVFKPAKKQEVTDIGVRRLSFKAVAGSFVDSRQAGQLFVIRGMVNNNYPKSRSFILVKGAILDDKGKIVKRKMAYAGNTFTDEQLQAMSIEQINQGLKNRPGKGNRNVKIQPGASIPIMVVFNELPDNLSEFTVEAVSSSPGK